MKKLAIAIMTRIERMSTSTLERANLVLQFGAVGLLFAGFLFGTTTIVVGYVLGKRQAAEVATANRGAAEANATASNAHAETTRLNVELSQINLRLEEQKERTARAESTLLKERAKRIDLATTVSNRWLTTAELKSLSTDMSKFSGQRASVSVFPVNFESNSIANLILGILGNAKWSVPPSVEQLASPPTPTRGPFGQLIPVMVQGILIMSTPDPESKTAGRALFDALKGSVAAGTWSPENLPDELPRVWVFVGDKPSSLSIWVDKK